MTTDGHLPKAATAPKPAIRSGAVATSGNRISATRSHGRRTASSASPSSSASGGAASPPEASLKSRLRRAERLRKVKAIGLVAPELLVSHELLEALKQGVRAAGRVTIFHQMPGLLQRGTKAEGLRRHVRPCSMGRHVDADGRAGRHLEQFLQLISSEVVHAGLSLRFPVSRFS